MEPLNSRRTILYHSQHLFFSVFHAHPELSSLTTLHSFCDTPLGVTPLVNKEWSVVRGDNSVIVPYGTK
ncbi:hypothetical protein CI610_03297 [invertebrate metagenome]|uniref:Uncharacterized protein n=1 Tax=invertebrate metagenome TaxID=1711999 RepID=A0A2H9T3H0_9ZZZZ